jgi:DNA-binding MarR family transcriptional regulator
VQLRILVVIVSRGSASLSEVAAATDISVSKASRRCDRMVVDGLIARADDPRDRRNLHLTLTPVGRRIVARVTDARRKEVAPMLAAMDGVARGQLVAALREFTAAGGEPEAKDLWAMGWRT